MDFTHLVYAMNARVLAPALTLCLAGGIYGQTFVPVDVTSELNGLEIKIRTNNIGAQVILNLQNEEDFAVACHAVFNNGPQTPVERRLILKAEEHSQMTAPLFRSVTRVRVNLVCDREQAGSAASKKAETGSEKDQ